MSTQDLSQYQVNYGPTDLRHYLYTHDLSTASPKQCTLTENRFKTPFVDPASGKTTDLYCWKGRIRTEPDCVIGSVCDPFSYTNARSSFCRTWGCQPDLFVSNEGTADAGLPVVNQRGGVVVYTPKAQCEGGIAKQFNCMLSGIRQSFANAFDPKNRSRLLMSMMLLSAFVITGVILFRKFHHSKGGKRMMKLNLRTLKPRR